MSSSSSEHQANGFSSSDSTGIHTPISSSSSSESLSRARTRSRSPATGASIGGSRNGGSVRRRRSPSKQISTTHTDESNGRLTAPQSAWRTISRSPSPLGLIPIHRSFNSLIHRHEVPRKALHVSIGGIVLYLYRNGYQPSMITPVLLALLVPIASADILRFSLPGFNSLYIRVLGALMRESEVKGWNGVIWYLLGCLVVLHFFPKDVAVVSILLLSWCDTAASTFGRAWGKYTPAVRKGKSLAGCIAAFVVGVATAAMFWGSFAPNTPTFANDPVGNMAELWRGNLALDLPVVGIVKGATALTIGSLWTGFAASFSEFLPVFGADDNIVIPIVSAAGIWVFLKAFAI